MEYTLKQLHEMCKESTVLYAEDVLEEQEQMNILLKRIFKEVYLADNGTTGLTLFEQNKPDIVITDIQMPHQNGFDMVNAIKEISPQTPILVTTAYNEEKHFLRAIESGIDAFLLKPLNKQKFFDALFKIMTQKAYQTQKEELERIKKIQEINHIAEESIREIANIVPFPTLFYKEDKLVFINNSANQTFEAIKLSSIDCETDFINEFNITKEKKQKIKFPTPSGLHKIYRVYPNTLLVGTNNTLMQAYIFIDITVAEYQKLKLDNFALFMYNKSQTRKEPIKVVSLMDKERENEPLLATKKAFLSQEDEAILRKTHYNKISAQEYLKELGDVFSDEIDELKDVGDDLNVLIEHLITNKKEDTIAKISKVLLVYTAAMESLSQFKDLGYALRNVTRFLNALPKSVDKRKLTILLGALAEDLSQWYQNIFIHQSAINIHYLDSSLLSSCFQMEAAFNQDMADTIEDDLELF